MRTSASKNQTGGQKEMDLATYLWLFVALVSADLWIHDCLDQLLISINYLHMFRDVVNTSVYIRVKINVLIQWLITPTRSFKAEASAERGF